MSRRPAITAGIPNIGTDEIGIPEPPFERIEFGLSATRGEMVPF